MLMLKIDFGMIGLGISEKESFQGLHRDDGKTVYKHTFPFS